MAHGEKNHESGAWGGGAVRESAGFPGCDGTASRNRGVSPAVAERRPGIEEFLRLEHAGVPESATFSRCDTPRTENLPDFGTSFSPKRRRSAILGHGRA